MRMKISKIFSSILPYIWRYNWSLLTHWIAIWTNNKWLLYWIGFIGRIDWKSFLNEKRTEQQKRIENFPMCLAGTFANALYSHRKWYPSAKTHYFHGISYMWSRQKRRNFHAIAYIPNCCIQSSDMRRERAERREFGISAERTKNKKKPNVKWKHYKNLSLTLSCCSLC